MIRVGGAEEGALVVVKPPRQAGIAGVLEIDDGVFIAVEQVGVEGLGSPVSHARVPELGGRVNRPVNEAAEKCGRGRAIEAMVVVEHPFKHAQAENLSACLNARENATAIAGELPIPV